MELAEGRLRLKLSSPLLISSFRRPRAPGSPLPLHVTGPGPDQPAAVPSCRSALLDGFRTGVDGGLAGVSPGRPPFRTPVRPFLCWGGPKGGWWWWCVCFSIYNCCLHLVHPICPPEVPMVLVYLQDDSARKTASEARLRTDPPPSLLTATSSFLPICVVSQDGKSKARGNPTDVMKDRRPPGEYVNKKIKRRAGEGKLLEHR